MTLKEKGPKAKKEPEMQSYLTSNIMGEVQATSALLQEMGYLIQA